MISLERPFKILLLCAGEEPCSACGGAGWRYGSATTFCVLCPYCFGAGKIRFR